MFLNYLCKESGYMKVFKKLLAIMFSTFAVVFILALLLYIASIINTKNSDSKLLGIGNIRFFEIKDQSAASGIDRGDLVFIAKLGEDSIRSGDIIVYMDREDQPSMQEVIGIKGDVCIVRDVTHNVESGPTLDIEKIVGKYIFGVPLIGYALGYIQSQNGIIICIAVPLIFIAMYLFIVVIDRIHNFSRHRKRILRRKERRRERYRKEYLYEKNRVVI